MVLSRSMLLNQGQMFAPGDIWQCQQTFLVVTPVRRYWHLVSRDQGFCQTSDKAQDRLPHKELSGLKFQ